MLLARRATVRFRLRSAEIYRQSECLLTEAIAHEHILGHITIHLDSRPCVTRSQIRSSATWKAFNTPFAANAFVESARATFWIEWVASRISDPETEPCPPIKEIEPFWPEGSYCNSSISGGDLFSTKSAGPTSRWDANAQRGIDP